MPQDVRSCRRDRVSPQPNQRIGGKEVNTAVVKGEDFQTRMFERIKAQMGELMTDEELKKIVDAALQKAFFEPTIIVTNPGHYTEKQTPGPSVFTQLVHDLLQENVKKLTKGWME